MGNEESSQTILLEPHPGGILLSVRAQPGSRKDEVRGVQNGCFKVAVTQVAEKGKANKAITKFLAKCLGLRHSQVELFRGETSAEKQFLISGVTETELRLALSKCLGE